MSTKTTFKRIALVTVAALGFGVMSVAPSSAVPAGNVPINAAYTLSDATSTIVLGSTAKTTLTTSGYFSTGDTVTTTVTLKSFPSDASSTAVSDAITSVEFTAIDTETAYTGGSAGGSSQITVDPGTAVAAATVDVGVGGGVAKLVKTRTLLSAVPTAVGTYVYTITSADTSTVKTTQTWTVVVTAAVLGAANAFIDQLADATEDDADGVTAAATATSFVAAIQVNQFSDALKTAALATKYKKAIGAVITGAGALSTSSSASDLRGPAISIAAGSIATPQAVNDIYVYADGRTGKGTITITIGDVVITKEVVFFGTATGYDVTVQTGKTNNIGVTETGTLTVKTVDANANTVSASPTIYAISSDATVASVAITATGVATVTGVKAGTATISICNTFACTSATIKKDVVVTILPKTAPTLSWKFDKDSYDAGEKMTLTVTATGVADGARALFTAAPVANFNLSGGSTAPVGSPVIKLGVATYTMYAPSTPGTFKFTASVGLDVDTEIAAKKAVDDAGGTYTATVVSVSAVITNPALTAAQEATDAANEATDAGNNAKDAADQAIEAADAATIAAQDAAAAAEAAGEMAVEAAEAAGAIAQDALDAANAATDAALSAAEAADAATAAATEAKESADAATAAVAELSTKVAALMAALNAKVTTLSNLVAKIAKKVKA